MASASTDGSSVTRDADGKLSAISLQPHDYEACVVCDVTEKPQSRVYKEELNCTPRCGDFVLVGQFEPRFPMRFDYDLPRCVYAAGKIMRIRPSGRARICLTWVSSQRAARRSGWRAGKEKSVALESIAYPRGLWDVFDELRRLAAQACP